MAKKPQRDLYRGTAIIMGVSIEGADDWKEWEKRDLSDVDKTNAFKIVYDVAEGDAQGARHDIKVEVSHRELKGAMLDWFEREDGAMPTQIDVALRSLVGQDILRRGATENDIALAVDDSLIGRAVTVRAYEEQSDDGKWWPRCVFASKFARITGADKAARVAAFLSGKPAPAPSASVAAPAQNAIPAPADDDIEMPF